MQVVTSLGDPEKAMNKRVAAVLLHDPNAMNYSFSVFTSHRLLSRIDQTVGRVSEAEHSVEPLILVLLPQEVCFESPLVLNKRSHSPQYQRTQLGMA